MKRYLNSNDRFRVIAVSALSGQIKETIDLWSSLNRSPLVLKYLRSSRTFAIKALEELYKEISEEEQERLWNYANKTKFGLMTNSVNKDKPVSKYGTDDTELIKDIAEAVTEVNCKNCKREACNCNIRQCFQAWEIEPINTIVENNMECEYRW